MSYKVDFASEAEADLNRISPLLASALLDDLDAVAGGDPYDRLEPHRFPFKPVDWLLTCRLNADGDDWIVHAGVSVRPADRTLTVLWIATPQPRTFG